MIFHCQHAAIDAADAADLFAAAFRFEMPDAATRCAAADDYYAAMPC